MVCLSLALVATADHGFQTPTIAAQQESVRGANTNVKTTNQNVALMLSAFLVWLSFAAGGERSPLQSKHEESVKRQHGKDQVGRVVEIRSYNLKPGTRNHFHELFVREALPLLQRWKVDVVAYGPSLHDDNSYFLMRAFSSIDNRQKVKTHFMEATNGGWGRAKPYWPISRATPRSSFGLMKPRFVACAEQTGRHRMRLG